MSVDLGDGVVGDREGGDDGEFGVQFLLEPAEADGQLIEAVGGDGAAAQRVEDLPAPPRRDRGAHPPTPNCSRSAGSTCSTS